jgi:hypothetical protein
MYIQIKDNTLILPERNKGSIFNYCEDIDLLIKDGFRRATVAEEKLINQGPEAYTIIKNKIIDITTTTPFKKEKAQKVLVDLVQYAYAQKAAVAYTGIRYDYNGTEVIFQTNSTSAINIASADRDFKSNPDITEIDWKFWTTSEAVNYPVFIVLSKALFYQFDAFARKVGKEAFDKEKAYIAQFQELTAAELLDDAGIQLLKDSILSDFNSINTKLVPISTEETGEETNV